MIENIKADPMYMLSRFILLTVGSLTSAAAVVIFLLPVDIAPAGVSGLAVILQEIIGIPIGLTILIANIPIQLVAFKNLKGWKTLVFTVYSVLLYSIALELLPLLVPVNGVTDDGFLSAVIGGVIGGIGGGLIYRAGGTVGGTSTIAQIIRRRYGLSLGTASLFGDTIIIGLAGIVFGWEAALYALIAVFVNRFTSDYVIEGSSNTCTALIITDYPAEVSSEIKETLHHGVTSWGVGGSTGDNEYEHQIILVSIMRSEIYTLRHIMREIDPNAFVTVLSGEVVFGSGFKSMYPELPLRLDEVES